MIIGVGIDLVDLDRFESKIADGGLLAKRIFTETERVAKAESLAGFWAAKEAFIKAIGHSEGISFQEIEIIKDSHGKPSLKLSGQTASVAKNLGIDNLHLSISHDGKMAVAMLVAESVNS